LFYMQAPLQWKREKWLNRLRIAVSKDLWTALRATD